MSTFTIVTRNQPLDCKASWLACVCISIASCVCVGTCYIYGVFFPEVLREFQAGKAKTAIPGSFSTAFLTILCPISSLFFTRFGGRICVVCGAIISALGLLGSSFAPNIYVLSVTYGLLLAWGSCLIYMAGFLIVPLYFDKHRSLATGMVSAGPGAGVLIMSPVAQTLIDRLDWRKAMLILGAINLATAVFGAAISRTIQPEIPNEDSRFQRRRNCFGMSFSCNLAVLKDPWLVLVVTMNVVLYLGHYMPLVHLIKYAEDLGISSDESSWIYPIAGTISTISRVITGKIGDTGRVSFYHTYQTGLLLIVVTNFLVPMARKVEHLYVYAAMQGICEGLYMTSTYCLAMAVNPRDGLGWLMFFTGIPMFISPPLAGFIADTSGSYKPVFYTAGSVLIVAFFVPYLRHCIKPKHQNKTLIVVQKETVITRAQATGPSQIMQAVFFVCYSLLPVDIGNQAIRFWISFVSTKN